jgi:Flp pilus assembly CpaF family ATPase
MLSYKRYQRYGHTLDALDLDGDGIEDVMVLTGGYSPDPSNDVWVTEDGNRWT